MVSTTARENKNSLFTDRSYPTLNTMDCDDRIRDQIWKLLLTVCNTVVSFSLKIRVLQVILVSVFTFAPELSFDCSNSEPEYVSCSAIQLFAFPSKCKPSYFPFSHPRTFVLNPQCELFGSLSSQCSQSPIFSWNCSDIARLTRLDCSQSSFFP